MARRASKKKGPREGQPPEPIRPDFAPSEDQIAEFREALHRFIKVAGLYVATEHSEGPILTSPRWSTSTVFASAFTRLETAWADLNPDDRYLVEIRPEDIALFNALNWFDSAFLWIAGTWGFEGWGETGPDGRRRQRLAPPSDFQAASLPPIPPQAIQALTGAEALLDLHPMGAPPPRGPKPYVVLAAEGRPPSVKVYDNKHGRMTAMEPLKRPQLAVVKSLCKAWPDSLSTRNLREKAMEELGGSSLDVPGAIRRLKRDHPLWKDAILSGAAGDGYRIASR